MCWPADDTDVNTCNYGRKPWKPTCHWWCLWYLPVLFTMINSVRVQPVQAFCQTFNSRCPNYFCTHINQTCAVTWTWIIRCNPSRYNAVTSGLVSPVTARQEGDSGCDCAASVGLVVSFCVVWKWLTAGGPWHGRSSSSLIIPISLKSYFQNEVCSSQPPSSSQCCISWC